jgi:hypothetical protein
MATSSDPAPIIAFARARLAEDERTAQGLAGATRFVGGKPDFYGVGGPAAEAFWDRFDPARVLRQVAAGRRILARHHDDGRGYCAGCPNGEISGDPEWEIDECPENRDLASFWSDDPGYQQRWAS